MCVGKSIWQSLRLGDNCTITISTKIAVYIESSWLNKSISNCEQFSPIQQKTKVQINYRKAKEYYTLTNARLNTIGKAFLFTFSSHSSCDIKSNRSSPLPANRIGYDYEVTTPIHFYIAYVAHELRSHIHVANESK